MASETPLKRSGSRLPQAIDEGELVRLRDLGGRCVANDSIGEAEDLCSLTRSLLIRLWADWLARGDAALSKIREDLLSAFQTAKEGVDAAADRIPPGDVHTRRFAQHLQHNVGWRLKAVETLVALDRPDADRKQAVGELFRKELAMARTSK